jgi:cold shock CspA family protein
MTNDMETPVDTDEKKPEVRLHGKIIKVSPQGYGFISSKDIEFTRIFFHWTSLRPDTLPFKELRAGMKVSFVDQNVEDRGHRAIKVKVETE